jgi:hypothetical protein
MALLLILLTLFGFVLAGVGSGSSGSGATQGSLRAKSTSCVVVTWEKGAAAQQHPCRRSPAKP